SRRVAASTDTPQATASRQAAPASGPVPGQFAASGSAALAVVWLMAALAGETPAASATTIAARVLSMAAARWRSSGGLHSAPAAEPTSRQTRATSRPAATMPGWPAAAVTLPARPDPGALLAASAVSTSNTIAAAPSTAPPPSGTIRVASWARAGPVAAATQARAASGSAVSIALVRNATTGTSIAPLQSSVSARDVDPAAPTAISSP